MKLLNEIEAMEDGGFVGNMASFDYDFDFTMKPVAEKRTERSPDFDIMVKTPRNRWVPIGAAWTRTSGNGNEYHSLSVNLRGVGRINVNAVNDPDGGERMKLIEFANSGGDGAAI